MILITTYIEVVTSEPSCSYILWHVVFQLVHAYSSFSLSLLNVKHYFSFWCMLLFVGRLFNTLWCLYINLCIPLPNQVLHEALIRQEELMAYIDSHEKSKFKASEGLMHHVYLSYKKKVIC